MSGDERDHTRAELLDRVGAAKSGLAGRAATAGRTLADRLESSSPGDRLRAQVTDWPADLDERIDAAGDRLPENYVDVDVSDVVRDHRDYYRPPEETFEAGSCLDAVVQRQLIDRQRSWFPGDRLAGSYLCRVGC